MQTPFAEIIESSLIKITAQCWDIDIVPTFGQCVEIKGEYIEVYALINHIQTGAFDSLRKPSPFKKTIAQLKKEQPHIFEFLVTTFTCIPFAYSYQGKLFYAPPPEPPRIHEFIQPISFEKISILFSKKSFLTSIFSMQDQISNIDELILACMRIIHNRRSLSVDFYTDLLGVYALLIGNDYRRVRMFASRLEEIF